MPNVQQIVLSNDMRFREFHVLRAKFYTLTISGTGADGPCVSCCWPAALSPEVLG